MAFVKDGTFDIFKNDVETNFNSLEKRVEELEALLKKYNGGVTVEEVVPEPTPEPEPEVVEEEVVEEDEEEVVEEEESSSKSKKKK